MVAGPFRLLPALKATLLTAWGHTIGVGRRAELWPPTIDGALSRGSVCLVTKAVIRWLVRGSHTSDVPSMSFHVGHLPSLSF